MSNLHNTYTFNSLKNINESENIILNINPFNIILSFTVYYKILNIEYKFTEGFEINMENGNFFTFKVYDSNRVYKRLNDYHKLSDFLMTLELNIDDNNSKFILTVLTQHIKNQMCDNDYFKNKNIKELFHLIVDFFLYKRNIKPHDNIYTDIFYGIPKVKYLKKNDYKFLPSILDNYGIKNKYFLKEINKNKGFISFITLKNLCKLLGDEYINHIKKFDWRKLTDDVITTPKIYKLKNDKEIKNIVKVLSENTNSAFLREIFKLCKLRDDIYKLSDRFVFDFNFKDVESFEKLKNDMSSVHKLLKKNYKTILIFPENLIQTLEVPFKLYNTTYTVKVLKDEEDFFIEGEKMKNCMKMKFNLAYMNIYLSVSDGDTTTNIHFNQDKCIQHLGKTNTKVDGKWNTVSDYLSMRLKTYGSFIIYKKRINIRRDEIETEFSTYLS